MKRAHTPHEPYQSGEGRFQNHRHEKREGFLFHTFSIFMQTCALRMRRRPAVSYVCQQEPVERSVQPVLTWIGHSSFLLQVDNINILCDPLFGRPMCLYPRIVPPGIALAKLPPIDVILISHNHIDHLEVATLKYLSRRDQRTTMCVPAGDAAVAQACGFKHIHACSWWDACHLRVPFVSEHPLVCTFVPAHHWSQRRVLDYNRSLWGGWVIRARNSTVYFGGDSAYSSCFAEIGMRFPDIQTAILPIGPCEPRAWMTQHMDAADAGRAFLEVGAQQFVPMHWGTFHFGIEEPELPLKRLRAWWHDHEAQLGGKTLLTPKIGERLLLPAAQTFVPAHTVPGKQAERAL